ncbi:hypothetical protein [Microbacterium lacticum]|uniref:hypothetical protein n=1 Tax=Microbacterium lacticum TaxID=33885 RepID=UPI001F59B5D5|nr:hypothetical protein [Microbacterium lacticum]
MPHAAKPHSGNDALTVLVAMRRPGAFLKYVDQVTSDDDDESGDVHFRFAPGRLDRFDEDVVHVLSRDVERLAGNPRESAARRIINAGALVYQLHRRRIALVQTTLESADTDKRDLPRRILDAATTAWITLEGTVRTPRSRRTRVIPQSHYRDRFIGYPQSSQQTGRLLFCSTSRLPDSADRLAEIVRVTRTPDLTLRLAGPPPLTLGVSIEQVQRRAPGRLTHRFETLSDGALAQEIDEAELVIPAGADAFETELVALMALSRSRPVLVASSDSMRLLAEEVGPGWIHLYTNEPSPARVDAALAAHRNSPPEAPPNLERRDPRSVSAAYSSLYGSASRRARNPWSILRSRLQ